MLKTLIVGASGYTGAELAAYLQRHSHVALVGLFVSEQSQDSGKSLADLYPQLRGVVDLPLQPLIPAQIPQIAEGIDVVFLATDHKVSHDLAPLFLAAGCVVFDLSGAFRVNDMAFYSHYYGFTHQHPHLLAEAVYGLAEWPDSRLQQASLVAVPGCYPTAALLALKPLVAHHLLDSEQWPVINAVSGVSGAGRKAGLNNSFCEVSLQAYGVFTHRHQPEIAAHLGCPVIFTPHLGPFARGILATITCRLKMNIHAKQVSQAYREQYQDSRLIRLYDKGLPALKSVVGTPFCDIGYVVDGQHLIVVAAEDNLLKGAASQAVQCFNQRFGFAETEALLFA